MSDDARARLVGTNHVVLPVGDVDDALAFFESILAFDVRGQTDAKAFLDAGDQFLVLAEVEERSEPPDDERHVGVVVDDVDLVRDRLDEAGVEPLDTSGLDVHDPWGNRLQFVDYERIQFTKADHVLAGMGLSDLEKSDEAIAELAEKGMAPDGE